MEVIFHWMETGSRVGGTTGISTEVHRVRVMPEMEEKRGCRNS